MKKIGLLVLGILFTTTVNLAGAETIGPTISEVPSVAPTTTLTPAERVRLDRQQRRIGEFIKNVDREIERRVTILEKLSLRVGEMKKINESEKAVLLSQIEEQIKTLNEIKLKIGADTEISVLKEDRKMLFTHYSVFSLFIPKIQILATADRVLETVRLLESLSEALESRIKEMKAAGLKTSSLEQVLKDLKNRVSDASEFATKAISLVTGLTPDEGNEEKAAQNKKALRDARTALRSAILNQSAALQNVKFLRSGLKPIIKTNTNLEKVATSSAR